MRRPLRWRPSAAWRHPGADLAVRLSGKSMVGGARATVLIGLVQVAGFTPLQTSALVEGGLARLRWC